MTERELQRIKNALDALRRQPCNKQCADCRSLSTPYVNLSFGTFVCARCAGVHREFGHKVKSISNSVFKMEEVQAIGGNEVDKQTYLPYWSEQIFRLPEAGNEDTPRVREFIRSKYVEKRFCAEQPAVGIPGGSAPAEVPSFACAPGISNTYVPSHAAAPVSTGAPPHFGMGLPQPAHGLGFPNSQPPFGATSTAPAFLHAPPQSATIVPGFAPMQMPAPTATQPMPGMRPMVPAPAPQPVQPAFQTMAPMQQGIMQPSLPVSNAAQPMGLNAIPQPVPQVQPAVPIAAPPQPPPVAPVAPVVPVAPMAPVAQPPLMQQFFQQAVPVQPVPTASTVPAAPAVPQVQVAAPPMPMVPPAQTMPPPTTMAPSTLMPPSIPQAQTLGPPTNNFNALLDF
ncbi:putative GTPase activating protein for ARF [Giardia muris]|uniref:Putative GTPase activating protein for ARF n=1 Tax=Giardia muris TaxID=5742 RepID=A0A4Z1SQ43_GIAMU|nr:putative GTPase activating protein for ARF [Giardia muris]|eukprot:TNJ27926.1 putative GTPase activating protein for ARF [Giardia muris]